MNSEVFSDITPASRKGEPEGGSEHDEGDEGAGLMVKRVGCACYGGAGEPGPFG